MIINRNTNKIDIIALGVEGDIKIGDMYTDRVSVTSFSIFKGSNIDLNKFVVDHDDKMKTRIKLSNNKTLAYDTVQYKWLNMGDIKLDDKEHTDDFGGEVVSKYRKFITKLKEHNINTVVIGRETITTTPLLSKIEFLYLLSNLSKNGITLVFIDDAYKNALTVYTRQLHKHDNDTIDKYIKNNGIFYVCIDYSLMSGSFFNQIHKYLPGHDYKNFFQRLIGERLLHYDKQTLTEELRKIGINVSSDALKHALKNYINLRAPIEKSTFEYIEKHAQVELMIVEKKYGVLPHEILHISINPCSKYNTLELPLLNADINKCIYDNSSLRFIKTAIYNFTNNGQYICCSVVADECINFCAVIDDIDNLHFAKCVVDFISKDKDE